MHVADGTYSADGTSCIDHTVLSCAPGESYTAGTDTEDGVCDACADGTYSAGGTETTCTPHEVTSCAPGQSYTPATNIEDGVCVHVRMEPMLRVALEPNKLCSRSKLYTSNKYRSGTCTDGTYSAGGTETTCTPQATSCAPGQSYTPATNIEDGRCDACADGTYSAVDGTSCIDHTVLSCAPGESYTAIQTLKTAFVMHV